MRIDIKGNASDIVDEVAAGIKLFSLLMFVDILVSFNEVLKSFFKLLEVIVK